MANKNKKIKEPIYLFNDMTWRFVKEEDGYWLMTRIKDGYRAYLKKENLEIIE